MTFDDWFLKVSSWGLTHDQLVTASFTAPGNDPGDVVYTSPSGSVMTRHICSHWINFYGAAQFGWSAALSQSSPDRPTDKYVVDDPWCRPAALLDSRPDRKSEL